MELLGLTPETAAVHRALLRAPETPVPELVHTTGLAEPVVQEALGTLRDRGLLRGLVPLRPDLALEQALLAAEQEVTARRSALQEAHREVHDLVELYVGGLARSERTLEVERIDTGMHDVQKRIDELVLGATREVLAIAPSYSVPAIFAEELAHTAEMASRGVDLRTVVNPAAMRDPDRLGHARAMAAVGEALRVHPDPPVRMLLFDRRVAIVPINPAAPAEGALLIWSATVVTSLVLLYEFVWSQSQPLRVLDESAPDGPGPRGARLLQLLTAGLTDEAMARHLGLSVRTVRRESAQLLERLGAQSRFQAGVEAARRGWV